MPDIPPLRRTFQKGIEGGHGQLYSEGSCSLLHSSSGRGTLQLHPFAASAKSAPPDNNSLLVDLSFATGSCPVAYLWILHGGARFECVFPSHITGEPTAHRLMWGEGSGRSAHMGVDQESA